MTKLFNNDQPTPELDAQDDLSDQNDNVDHLSELVGEGKKFRDAQALAKGKKASDEHIATLERELAELRKEMERAATLEEFMAKIEATQGRPSNPNPQGQDEPPQPNASGALTAKEVEKILEQKLNQSKEDALKERNVQAAQAGLEQAWGPQYARKLTARAKELGLSQEFLSDLAERSPKAFLMTVGAEGEYRQPDPNAFVAPRSNVNPVAPRENGNVKNKAYYDKIKKTNPKWYWSKEGTAERHRNAQLLGEKFFA